MSLLLLFQYSDESLDYFNFRTLVADRRNTVLGGMDSKGKIYCRVDVDKYRIRWDDLKYITYKHTLSHNYWCIKCGQKITKDNNNNRYYHINKIGKNRRWN